MSPNKAYFCNTLCTPACDHLLGSIPSLKASASKRKSGGAGAGDGCNTHVNKANHVIGAGPSLPLNHLRLSPLHLPENTARERENEKVRNKRERKKYKDIPSLREREINKTKKQHTHSNAIVFLSHSRSVILVGRLEEGGKVVY